MPVSPGTGLGTPLQSAGAPAAGTSEVQTLTIGGTATGGTFRLSFQGLSTGAINHNAAAAAVDSALEAVPSIGAGGVTCAGGPLPGTPVTITFAGNLAARAVPTIAVASNNLTGTNPTVSVAKTTPGVDATGLGAPKGALLIRLDTGVLLINTGSAQAPTWVAVGSQT